MSRSSHPLLKPDSEFWRRRQKISTKRKKNPSFKGILVFLLFVLFIGFSYSGFVRFKNFARSWEFLKIKDVKVHAIKSEMKKEIEDKIESSKFGSILFADSEKIKELIIKNPYVKDVKIKKVLPSTIEVFVKEREGVAIVKKDKFYIIDENCEIIKETEEIGFLPLIRDGSLNDKIAIGIAVSFIKEVKTLGHDKYLEEVDISNPLNMGVRIKDSRVKIYLGESDFLDKFERFLAIQEVLKKEFGDIEHVGFYDKERVYIKMQSQNEKVKVKKL